MSTNPEEKQTMKQFLKETNEIFGENAAMLMSQDNTIKADTISTGIPGIDEVIGVPGVPRGRITEIYGAEASGKTTLCLHIINECQKLGLNAGFVDAEHALTMRHLDGMGIDRGKMVLSQPNDGEEALEIAEMMVLSDQFGVVIVDSVAALTPRAELDKDMGEATMGSQARLMSQAMRKLVAKIAKHNVAMIFTNQTRAKLGFFTVGETTSGGNALKFYASLRLQMKYIGQLKDSGGSKTGGKYKLIVVKNKLAVPFREVEFTIRADGIHEK